MPDNQPLTAGEFHRTMTEMGERIDRLTAQVSITNGRVSGLERSSASESQKVVNLEREVFTKHRRNTSGEPAASDADAKPLTRWDLTVAVAVVGAVVALLAFLGKV